MGAQSEQFEDALRKLHPDFRVVTTPEGDLLGSLTIYGRIPASDLEDASAFQRECNEVVRKLASIVERGFDAAPLEVGEQVTRRADGTQHVVVFVDAAAGVVELLRYPVGFVSSVTQDDWREYFTRFGAEKVR
jgi:hypothetical protein